MMNSLFTLGVISLLALSIVYFLGIFYPDNEYLNLLKEQKYINIFLLFALICFGLGLLLRMVQPIRKVFKNRCKKCKTPIPDGDIYCSTCLRDLKNFRY